MRRVFAFVVVLCAVAGCALADEKAAAANASTLIISTHMVPPNPNGVTFVSPWITVLSTQIQPPGGKDLFLGFSAHTTLADVRGQGGSGTPFSTTFTEEVNYNQGRVLVNGGAAHPVPEL